MWKGTGVRFGCGSNKDKPIDCSIGLPAQLFFHCLIIQNYSLFYSHIELKRKTWIYMAFNINKRIAGYLRMLQKFSNANKNLLFLIVMLVVSVYYQYPSTVLKRPQSVHRWRQCDGASIALNYYYNGLNFLQPEVHFLHGNDITNGKAAPSEVPLLYFVVALLYYIFGYHDFIFRLFNLLIFYLGLFYLFKLSRLILKDFFWSLVPPLMLFSSPVIVYYANNFIPNTVALSLAIIGWYHFFIFYAHRHEKHFNYAFIFFLLAGITKVTALSNAVIVLFLLFLDKTGISPFNAISKRRFWVKSAMMLFIFVLSAAWIFYAKWYNGLHGSHNFSTQTFPYWKMDKEQIAGVFHLMKVIWYRDYYFPATIGLFAILLVVLPFFLKKLYKPLLVIGYVQLAGFIVYCLMWFEGLAHHDYFFIHFYLMPVFFFLNGIYGLQKALEGKRLYNWIKWLALIFLITNIVHAKIQHHKRYYGWQNDLGMNADTYEITPFLREKGISNQDRVIYLHDVCLVPLYLMDQPGWFFHKHQGNYTPEHYMADSIFIQKMLDAGAAYIICNDQGEMLKRTAFHPYFSHLFGTFKNSYVFKLNDSISNFRINEKPWHDTLFFCGFETGMPKDKILLCGQGRLLKIGGLLQDTISCSGSKAGVFIPENPYDFSFYIKKIQTHDNLKIETCVYPKSPKLNIVISDPGNPNIRNDHTQFAHLNGIWDKAFMEYQVPWDFDNDSMLVYLWNWGNDTIFIDDIMVTKTRVFSID
jgi:hypothetical protein